jgi:hypothetical protein
VLEEQVPAEPVRDESAAVVIHDVSAQAETMAVNAPLGGDDAHSEVVEPRPGGTVDGEASAPLTPGDICLDLVEHSAGPNLFGGPASGEAVQAFESLSVVDPRVTELGCQVTLVEQGAGVFMGCDHRQAAAMDDGHGWPRHPAPNLG